MVRFLLGLAAASLIRSNKRLVGRGLAAILIKTEDVATCVAQQVHRFSAQISEDYEDLVAEAHADYDSKKRAGF
jgi:hypothetical protein